MFSLFPWLAQQFGWSEAWVAHHHHVLLTGLVAVVLLAVTVAAWRQLRNTEACIVPASQLTLAGAMECVVGLVRSLAIDIMGPRADRYMGLLGPLFIYLLLSNLLGVVPGFFPPTDNVNTTLAAGVVVFLYYNVVGIREQGLKHYLQHMVGPVVWLAPLMLAIELVSHLVRPASLSIRLFGNMTGDHMVLELFSGLTPIVVPVIFMCLAIFVSFIQAFVFTLLSMVYIALATDTEAH